MWNNVTIPNRQSFETMEQIRLDATVQTMLQQWDVNFKDNVATPADLPMSGNSVNDFRMALSNGFVYRWNGSAWVQPSSWWAGSQPLASYPIETVDFTLNPDGVTFSILDNLDVTILSNGKQRYNAGMTLPLPPQQTVEVWFGRPIALWAYDDGTTMQFEWTYGIEVDLMGLTPPLNLANQPTPGAIMLGAGICINLSASQKTIGVDSFNNFDDRRWSRSDTIYEQFIVSNNPAYGIYVDGTARFTNRAEFRVESPEYLDIKPVWYTVDETYSTGIIIPAGESQDFKISWVSWGIYILPLFMNPQGVIYLATVNIENTGGTDWEWWVDPLDDADITIQVFNTISSGYIGSYADFAEVTSSGIQLTEGNTALVNSIYYTYVDGNWITSQVIIDSWWIDISSADLLTVVSQPIELIPAPWAWKIIVVQQFVMNYNAWWTPYTYAWFLFLNMGGNTIFNLWNPLTWADVLKTAGGQSATLTENASVVMWGSSSDPTLGDGTMRMKLLYTIEIL